MNVNYRMVFVPVLICCTLHNLSIADTPVEVWWSSELLPGSGRWYSNPPDESEVRYKLDRQPDLAWQEAREGDVISIDIDAEQTYQSILGIGTSLEATTVYAIRKNKTEAQMREVLKALIDPVEGIGFNLFRITIGTSDFSDGRAVSRHPKGFYSYQDDPEAEFSVQPDIDLGIVEVLRLAQDVAAHLEPPQDIRFFATTWSPPGWMKTSGQLIGGTLKPGYEKQLAKYFRSFVEAYEALGIPIYAMTIQNEPNYTPTEYPGMRLTPAQERDIVVATYEEFHHNLDGRRELNTRLWINDHNFGNWVNADTVLSKLQAMGKKHYVDATAFHNYDDAPASSMSKLHERHPETDIQFSEHSEWGVTGIYNIQQYFRNWSRSYMYWVTMTTRKLDEHNQGPYNRLGRLGPTLVIEKNTNTPDWYVTPEFYLLGQVAKFIRPGAVRIECTPGRTDRITAVAFRNRDGRIAVLLVNQTSESQPVQLVWRDRTCAGNLPAKTVGTYVIRQ